MHKDINQRYQFNCWEKNPRGEHEEYPEKDHLVVILRSMTTIIIVLGANDSGITSWKPAYVTG